MIVAIDPKTIRTDCNTQSRVQMSESVIADYAEAMERGDTFPPILVFIGDDADEHVLADGFHRLHAHLRVRPNDPILADRRIGTVKDAEWASLGANQTHGLHRSNADKRNAVRRALLHRNGEELSNRQIAGHVGVHHSMVANMSRDMQLTGEIRRSDFRRCRDGRLINTKNISRHHDVPDATCAQCLNYDAGRGSCILDSSARPSCTSACPEFEAVPSERPAPEKEPIPEHFRLMDDPASGETRPTMTRACHYKPRHTLAIDVPLDDPTLAVVELRHQLGETYLDQCFVTWRMLKQESFSPDP